MTLFSISTFASGGGGGGYGGGSIGGSSSRQIQIDNTYETGKAIFNGRRDSSPKLSYCVTSDDEVVKIKSRSLKAYKNTTYDNLAQNLYICDRPDTLVGLELTRDDLLYVLYYLNKRYKLSLKG